MPRVHPLTQLALLLQSHFFLLKLLLNSGPVLINTLLKVIVKSLLFNTLLKLRALLVCEISEANFVFKSIYADFQQKALSGV